ATFSPEASTRSSERDVPVLLRRVLVALPLEQRQGRDEAWARRRGLDDIVDVAALGRDVRIREALAELRDLFGLEALARRGIALFTDLALEEDLDGSLGP